MHRDGEAYKKRESGSKVAVATSSKKNRDVEIEAWHGKPFDGRTLKNSIPHQERLTGWPTTNVLSVGVTRGRAGSSPYPSGSARPETAFLWSTK